jgi:hypothetical protein
MRAYLDLRAQNFLALVTVRATLVDTARGAPAPATIATAKAPDGRHRARRRAFGPDECAPVIY